MVTMNRPGNQERLPNEHTFLKQEKIAALGVAILQSNAWLPQFFTMFPGNRFRGAMNDTLTYPTRRVTRAQEYEWRTRFAPVQVQRIGTTFGKITLDKHIVQATSLTNEQATLDLASYRDEIMVPSLEAILNEINAKIMAGLRAVPFKHDDYEATPADKPSDFFLKPSMDFNREGVPWSNRFALVGTAVEEWLLRSDELQQDYLDGAGNIRQNVIGQLRGFTFLRGSSLVEETEMFLGHKSGLLVANVAPELPLDLPAGAKGRAAANGFSLLATRQYEGAWQASTAYLSTFLGVNGVNDELQLDANGIPELDEQGDPISTGLNVRLAKGTLTI